LARACYFPEIATGGIMTTATTAASIHRRPELLGQIVVVIGGSALETARRARAEAASVILAGRNPERLKQAALELDAQRTAAFDANDPASLRSFFQDIPTPIDHVIVTAGAPHYGPPLEVSPEEARRGLTATGAKTMTLKQSMKLQMEMRLLKLRVAKLEQQQAQRDGSDNDAAVKSNDNVVVPFRPRQRVP
jgi:NAD(P)-dependent dehydrogenase (short-subunit alcohol dehydrogenase family)